MKIKFKQLLSLADENVVYVYRNLLEEQGLYAVAFKFLLKYCAGCVYASFYCSDGEGEFVGYFCVFVSAEVHGECTSVFFGESGYVAHYFVYFAGGVEVA